MVHDLIIDRTYIDCSDLVYDTTPTQAIYIYAQSETASAVTLILCTSMATDGVEKKGVNPSILPDYNKQQLEYAVEVAFQEDEEEGPTDCWVASLVTLILCFWPLGLAAMIMSSKVSKRVNWESNCV
jgi:hypothetical protein